VNALSHYTDWTVGHVHSGALGWVAMITFGTLYHMIPRLWKTEMYSVKLINVHFWLATIGTLLYITAMWISGISQGLMWRAFDDFGNLQYSFVESVAAMHPFYVMRALGGVFFLSGMCLMAFNVFKTIRQGVEAAEAAGAQAAVATA
jgi:cytochrome c oxidase cbb3-type subunit I